MVVGSCNIQLRYMGTKGADVCLASNPTYSHTINTISKGMTHLGSLLLRAPVGHDSRGERAYTTIGYSCTLLIDRLHVTAEVIML